MSLTFDDTKAARLAKTIQGPPDKMEAVNELQSYTPLLIHHSKKWGHMRHRQIIIMSMTTWPRSVDMLRHGGQMNEKASTDII